MMPRRDQEATSHEAKYPAEKIRGWQIAVPRVPGKHNLLLTTLGGLANCKTYRETALEALQEAPLSVLQEQAVFLNNF